MNKPISMIRNQTKSLTTVAYHDHLFLTTQCHIEQWKFEDWGNRLTKKLQLHVGNFNTSLGTSEEHWIMVKICGINPGNQIQLHLNCKNTVQRTLFLSKTVLCLGWTQFNQNQTLSYIHRHVTSCLWLSVLFMVVFWLPQSSTLFQCLHWNQRWWLQRESKQYWYLDGHC